MTRPEAHRAGYDQALSGGLFDCPYSQGYQHDHELFSAWHSGYSQGHAAMIAIRTKGYANKYEGLNNETV